MWNKLRFKEKSEKSPLKKFTLHFLTYVFSERGSPSSITLHFKR